VKVDLALVGGGLANSLIAYRLHAARPDVNLHVLERGPTLGGNHTWSFHDSDLSADQRAWLQPLIEASWPRHELRFPNRHRVMQGAYNSVSSERLHRVVGQALDGQCTFHAEVTAVEPHRVELADGRVIEARAVIDGRGDPGGRHLDVAFQKFLGQFVRLETDHGLDGPILMDATVPQVDGYRFMYALPFATRELLIEDTYYSDTPHLDRDFIRTAIADYARERGWQISEHTGEEEGVLPIVLGGDIDAFWHRGPADVPRSGMRAALFHPTTGYSLLEAVRLADELVRQPELTSEWLYPWTRSRSLLLWRRFGYFRLLNRMLFRAAEPQLRYRIFERFYGLSEGLIQRFYAGQLRWSDKLRILIGRPPVPLRRALRSLPEVRSGDRRPSSTTGGTT
jgi:lycopene beta-cyclase